MTKALITLSRAQYDEFHQRGYVIVKEFVSNELVDAARERFTPLFQGDFETGLQPDEWNWRAGESPQERTRQICNGWKADRVIARLALSETVGRLCAELMGWPGARINQDNVIWKPPGAGPLGFHQDDAYQDWIVPASMVTCWMAMDDTSATGGTIEYVAGSNHWPVEKKKFTFHAPEDYHQGLKQAAGAMGVQQYQVDKITVRAGDAVFHHGRTWHGSGTNLTSTPRRSVVAHCMSSESRFHPTQTTPIYSRYKRHNSVEMDESYFPILYRQDATIVVRERLILYVK